jgi:hypothetical protein
MYTCRECERPINPATELCPYCGADLTESALPLPEAGAEKRRPGAIFLRWFALLGALWGFLWFVLPERVGDRAAEAEARAIETLREIRSALAAHAEARGGYPSSLEALGERARKPAQQAQKEGYSLHYTPGPSNPDGVVGSYTLEARPGNYGYRNFYTDQTGVVRATRENRGATAQDPPI